MRRKTVEKYIKIYTLYTLNNRTEQEISQELGINRRTVIRSLQWVDRNRISIPNEQFMRIAIDTIRQRKQELRKDMKGARQDKNWNAVVAFYREIKSNDEFELRLRGLLENSKSQPLIPIEPLNVFVDVLVKVFNEINELDTPEKRRRQFAERISKLRNWSEIRVIGGRSQGQKLRNSGERVIRGGTADDMLKIGSYMLSEREAK